MHLLSRHDTVFSQKIIIWFAKLNFRFRPAKTTVLKKLSNRCYKNVRTFDFFYNNLSNARDIYKFLFHKFKRQDIRSS